MNRDNSKVAPVHAPMDQFPSRDGELLIGGIPVSQLAARVGQTPFYAYDRRVIADKVSGLRKALPESIHIHFAMKANPMPVLVNYLAGLVDGLDVASGKELRVALDTGIDPDTISFAGPGKDDAELSMAVASGITVNLESETEMERITRAGERLGLTPKVAIRVNPDFELKASGMKMGGGSQQFGVDAERVPAMVRAIQQRDLDFQGFHIFTGSQNLKPEAITTAHDNIFDLVQRLLEDAPAKVRKLNIGGGFGIPYFPGERPLELAPIAERLRGHLAKLPEYAPDAEVIVELGRYLVGESGVYVSRIREKKISRGQTFLISDGGLHHHLAASGNFGQVIRKNYPAAIGNRMGQADTEQVSVVGPLCTPLDLLANKMQLPCAEAGDLVVIYQSGAYGLSSSPRDFLSHPHPVEVLV